jgi:hypothetical protein
MKPIKVVVDQEGLVAYPLGLKGRVVGQGETFEEALADAKSATAFHIETFGLELEDTVIASRFPSKPIQ